MQSSFTVTLTASRVVSLTYVHAGAAIWRKCTIKCCIVLKTAKAGTVAGKNEMYLETYTLVALSQILFQILFFSHFHLIMILDCIPLNLYFIITTVYLGFFEWL